MEVIKASLNGNDFWQRSGPYYFTDHSPHATESRPGQPDNQQRCSGEGVNGSDRHQQDVPSHGGASVLLNGTSIGLGYHPLNLLVGTGMLTIASKWRDNLIADFYVGHQKRLVLVNETNATLSFAMNLQYSDAGFYIFPDAERIGPDHRGGFPDQRLSADGFATAELVVSDDGFFGEHWFKVVWSVITAGRAMQAMCRMWSTLPRQSVRRISCKPRLSSTHNRMSIRRPHKYLVSNLFRFPNVGGNLRAVVGREL